MSDQRMDAARAALLKALTDQLKAAKASADESIRSGWHVGDRTTALLPDGRSVGTVTLAKGKASARLADETAFMAWVARVHPDQVEEITITRVSPGFTERLLSAARHLGEPVDAMTGELVPGIVVAEGDPYPTVRLAPDAAALIAGAWESGALAELVASLLRLELPKAGA